MRNLRDGGGGGLDVAHVRIVRFAEGSRHSDGEGVRRGQIGGVGGGPEVPARHESGNFRARDVLNVPELPPAEQQEIVHSQT